jgi:hypothetical protein
MQETLEEKVIVTNPEPCKDSDKPYVATNLKGQTIAIDRYEMLGTPGRLTDRYGNQIYRGYQRITHTRTL